MTGATGRDGRHHRSSVIHSCNFHYEFVMLSIMGSVSVHMHFDYVKALTFYINHIRVWETLVPKGEIPVGIEPWTFSTLLSRT